MAELILAHVSTYVFFHHIRDVSNYKLEFRLSQTYMNSYKFN